MYSMTWQVTDVYRQYISTIFEGMTQEEYDYSWTIHQLHVFFLCPQLYCMQR